MKPLVANYDGFAPPEVIESNKKYKFGPPKLLVQNICMKY